MSKQKSKARRGLRGNCAAGSPYKTAAGSPLKTSESGFTLIEVLISLSILVVLVFSASTLMRSSLDLRFSLADKNKVTQRVNTALQKITYDLEHAFLLSQKMPTRVDSVERRTIFRIEHESQGDLLAMTYMGHRALSANAKEGELSYVVYQLKESKKFPGRRHLYRGELPRVPESFKEDPPMKLFVPHIHSIRFDPWQGDSWAKDRWDSSRGDTNDLLPHMVRVTIKAWADEPSEEKKSSEDQASLVQYVTYVYLPYALNFKELKQRQTSFSLSNIK